MFLARCLTNTCWERRRSGDSGDAGTFWDSGNPRKRDSWWEIHVLWSTLNILMFKHGIHEARWLTHEPTMGSHPLDPRIVPVMKHLRGILQVATGHELWESARSGQLVLEKISWLPLGLTGAEVEFESCYKGIRLLSFSPSLGWFPLSFSIFFW